MRVFTVMALLAVLVSCSQEDQMRSPQTRWEYKIVAASEMVNEINKYDIDLIWDEKSPEPYQSILEYLNRLGDDGWELVSMGQAKEWGYGSKGFGEKFSPDGSLRGVPFVFKREVNPTR